MAYKATVILDSICSSISDTRLITLEVTFPRFILAEMNTHRALSKNSASSRAIPTQKLIERIVTDPVYPLEWGKNRPGMQATETINDRVEAEMQWEIARDNAIYAARGLMELGIHKQVVNRLLEPFMWHTAIITGTDWDNFFNLRCSDKAQPEMRHTAELMRDAIQGSSPREIGVCDWHLPYLSPEGKESRWLTEKGRIAISVAGCARVSYLSHDGERDPFKDFELYERLYEDRHLSPFEHIATPMRGRYANFQNWYSFRTKEFGYS